MQTRLFVLAALASAGLTTSAGAQPTDQPNAAYYYQFADATTSAEVPRGSTINVAAGSTLTLSVYLRQYRAVPAASGFSRNLGQSPAGGTYTENVTGLAIAGFTVLADSAPLATYGSFVSPLGLSHGTSLTNAPPGAVPNPNQITRVLTGVFDVTQNIPMSQLSFAPPVSTLRLVDGQPDYANPLYRAFVGTLVLNVGTTPGTQTLAFADYGTAGQTNIQDGLISSNDPTREGNLDFPLANNVVNFTPGLAMAIPNYNIQALGPNTSFFTLAVAPVPEPASFLLAGVAGVGLYVARRRTVAATATV